MDSHTLHAFQALAKAKKETPLPFPRPMYKTLGTDILCLLLESAETTLDEIETQHGSECSLYGDSWPGAQIDIENTRKDVKKLNALVESRLQGPQLPLSDIIF